MLCIEKLRNDLRLFDSPSSYSGKNAVPISIAVTTENRLDILRLCKLGKGKPFGFHILIEEIFSPVQILILLLVAKPLVNLILCLRGLDNLQPVPGRTFGVLARNNIYTVSILQLILYRYQLIVDLRPHHLIAHGGMNGISEINRCGALR